jgi:hypothetical protein
MGFKKMLTFKQSKRYEFIIRSIKVTSKTSDKTRIFKVSMWDNKINDFIRVDNYNTLEMANKGCRKNLVNKMKEDFGYEKTTFGNAKTGAN